MNISIANFVFSNIPVNLALNCFKTCLAIVHVLLTRLHTTILLTMHILPR